MSIARPHHPPNDPPSELRAAPRLGAAVDELMTAEQVAALLHMRPSTVGDYARRGLIPSIKLGRHRRFVRTDVARAIDRLRER